MKDRFRVIAIVSAYNEADIISPVIGHLVENGVDVYLIDNRSTDGTVEQARPWLKKGLLEIEEFPKEAPRNGPPTFDWGAILQRKEELAKKLPADWFIHHDADEFREAPWPGMSLKDAIRWVDRLGYSCIDFRVLNFPPVDDGFRPGADPREHLTRWEEPNVHDTVQLKSWKNTGAPVSLAASGGHEVGFRGRRVFPIQFLLRHYPIRSQEHGRRKVFEERKTRFLERERAKGWHVQYDRIEDKAHSFLGDPSRLQPYDADQIRFEVLLRNRVTREAEERAQGLQSALTAREQELGRARARNEELERKLADVQAVLANLERHAGNLEGSRAELEYHAKALEGERERLTRLLGNLESGRGELERHARNLEKAREDLTRKAAELEAERVDRERHVINLESARQETERYVASLQSFLSQRERELATLEVSRAEAERYARSLEEARTELGRHVAQEEGRSLELARLAGEREEKVEKLEARVRQLSEAAGELESRLAGALERILDLERKNRSLTEQFEAIRNSTTWRWSAPLRRIVDAFRAAR